MKKISTGERVSIQDIRRGINQLRLPHADAADAAIAGEQMLVEELMDTTPSSSFGEEAWRDGYIYDRGPAVATSPGDYSDDDGAEAVVNGTCPPEGQDASKDLFVKVEVAKLPEAQDSAQPTSLLSGALAAVKSQEQLAVASGPGAAVAGFPGGGAGGGFAGGLGAMMESGLTRSESRSSSTNEGDDDGEEADMADTGGCSARQLISAVLKQCQASDVAPGLHGRPPHAFDLRIADDGAPDLDFPELDGAAAIIDVGVDEFVLCEAGRTAPLLVVEVVVEGAGGAAAGKGGCSLVLQVSLFEPGHEDRRVSMSLPIELLPDPLWYGASATLQTRRRGSSSRTSGISMEGGSCDPSAVTRIRNIDTGEEIPIGDYESMVPPGISPKRLFGRGGYTVERGKPSR